MKLTKARLQQIIKEEIQESEADAMRGDAGQFKVRPGGGLDVMSALGTDVDVQDVVMHIEQAINLAMKSSDPDLRKATNVLNNLRADLLGL